MAPKRQAIALSEDPSGKRKRSPNWSQEENEALADEMNRNYHQLYGALSANVTDEKKQRIWIQISEAVSA